MILTLEIMLLRRVISLAFLNNPRLRVIYERLVIFDRSASALPHCWPIQRREKKAMEEVAAR
jgi:hypothetical protein